MAKRLTLETKIRRALEAHHRKARRQGAPVDVADTLAKIMQHILQEPIKVTLNMEGGVLQGARSTHPATTLNLIDFDEFETEKKDRDGRTEAVAQAQWDQAAREHHDVF